MLGLHAPDGAERVSRGLDSCDRAREIVVRLDGAGSGGVVDPGAACWVGISGGSGVMGKPGHCNFSPWNLPEKNPWLKDQASGADGILRDRNARTV